ncbi:TetR/AcrR family transcriptional regulator [Streptomyces lasalocidi]
MPRRSAASEGQERSARRVDARRNREKLLAAADEVLTAHGPYAPLDEIAKRAGVGNATLYRHFPTRQALLEAIYWTEVEALQAAGKELEEASDPAEALVSWLRAFIRHATAKRGLASALVAVVDDDDSPLLAACHDAIRSAGRPLFERAQRVGAIRPDITLDELLILVTGITLAFKRGDILDSSTRMLTFLMEGVRQEK